MNLFLFPTSYDIFGMVLLESMYFRLPVISTFNGGSQSLINQNNGVVLNNLDENKWVETVYDLIINQDSKNELGKKAQEQIINSFTWDKIVKKIFK
ncbi:glycosyltransferase [Bacillus sp. EB93]|nr:glycosyltransferase [Peribacillus frigoritolerans]